MCTHEGFPLVALPGGNVFFTDRDLTSAREGISCKRVSSTRALTTIVKAARYLARLVELP